MKQIISEKAPIWFVYDGECPICKLGATMFRVRQAVGLLYTVDARVEKDHPVMLLARNMALALKGVGRIHNLEH